MLLSEIYGYLYTGCIGVDMLLYRQPDSLSWNIHPCVEINMRQTMGMVAVQIVGTVFRKLIIPGGL